MTSRDWNRETHLVSRAALGHLAIRPLLRTRPEFRPQNGRDSNINGVELRPRPRRQRARSTGNHLVREATVGFSHEFYNSAKYGRPLGMLSLRHTIAE